MPMINKRFGHQKQKAFTNSLSSDGEEGTIYIYDEIDQWWGVSAKSFLKEIDALKTAKLIHVRVNCPGGDIFEARAIQMAMVNHPAKFIVHIDGMAASAASFLIQGADSRIIADGGFLMIHRATSGLWGNGDELLSWGEALNKMDASLCESYVKVTGQDKKQIQEWMDKETWFSSAEALEFGFVDEIVQAIPVKNEFDLSIYNHVPGHLTAAKKEGSKPESKYDMDAIARQIRLAEVCI